MNMPVQGWRIEPGPVTAAFAKRKGATPAQVAIGWLLAKKPWIVPIPGTTKLSRLENLGGATIEFTVDEVQSLEEASSNINIEGARYSPFHQSLVGR